MIPKMPDYRAAFEKAAAVLKPGDRVRMIAHGAARQVSYIFGGWDPSSPSGQYFVSKSGVDELHPWNITAVNGVPTSFRTPGAWND